MTLQDELATAFDSVSCHAKASAKAEAFLSFREDPTGALPPELIEEGAPTWRDAFLAWAENRGWDDEAWRLCLMAFGLANVFDSIAARQVREGSALSAETIGSVRAVILGTSGR